MSEETKALNRISTALGGEAKVQKKEILNEIAENVGGGGGGSSQFMVVTIVGDGDQFTCDKTYQQIKDAIMSGSIPIVKHFIDLDDGLPDFYHISRIYESGGDDLVGLQFHKAQNFYDSSDDYYYVYLKCFNIKPDNTITHYSDTIYHN